MPRGASEKLGELKLETDERIAALNALCPGDGALRGVAGSAREKIIFQLDRLKENFETACKRKEEMVGDIGTCNTLAPNGRIRSGNLAAFRCFCAILVRRCDLV
jgi:hypothetical protein